jgi:hypothetical protein
VLVGGAILFALGLATVALQAWTGYDQLTPLSLAPAEAVIGLGQSLVAIPLLGVVLHGVPAERTGVAGGVWTTTQQIAVAVGVAGIGTLFFTVADRDGFGTATVTAELTEAALAVVTAALAWTLPSARR